jgi:small subunit ribosomal protein S16
LATTIRLTRMGKKKRPFYRLVVLDSRKRRDGAYLANLGYYNPFSEPHEVQLHTDKIIDWLKKGASVSETARALLRAEGVLYRYALESQGMPPEEVAQKLAEWRQGAEERQARTAARRASSQEAAVTARAKAEAAKAEAEKAETARAEAEKAEAAKAEAEKAETARAEAEKAEAAKAEAEKAEAARAEAEKAAAAAAESGSAEETENPVTEGGQEPAVPEEG